jgi:Peptidase S46
LILTNHHVAMSCIQRVSSSGNDFLRDGFYAATPDRELACPDWEVLSLKNIDDVTEQIRAAVPAGSDEAAGAKARQAATAELEKPWSSIQGHRCEVISLFQGAVYHLYKYRKYTDIRLVFAPEHSVAFFGGSRKTSPIPATPSILRSFVPTKTANLPQSAISSKSRRTDCAMGI